MASNSKKDALTEEDKVIAVVIAETFNNNFQPITKYIPLGLLPLVNSPLLDYSLDWLQRCEVDETIIYCEAQPHSDEIRDHCRKWALRFGNLMKVTVISSENCASLGDAMRDLYRKSMLKNDFILLSGPVIGNLDLKTIMKNHKATVKKNANCVMSCVYLRNSNKEKPLDNARIINIITNSKTTKILSHKRLGTSSKFIIPIEIIQAAPKLLILASMEDPNIAICSDVIPSLFSDNFDYGTRDSLVQGLIEQEELLNCTVHAQVVEEGYAALVSSFRAYEDVSDALIRRKFLPLVPERSLSSQRIRYTYHPFTGSYWDSSAKFYKKCIGDNVVIDAGTEIDQRCKIRNTVVGKHCVIRENVTVNDSFLMSNVVVSKGCILDNCFIGNDVKLLPGVHLEPGVVVGANTVLGPNLKVNRGNRLVDKPPEAGPLEIKPLVCGKEGCAFEYKLSEEDTENDPQTVPWGEEREKRDSSDESNDASEESDVDEKRGPEGDDEVSSDEEREQEFENEVKDSLLNAFRNNSALDNVVLEINSSRHAYNVSMENVLATVTKAILHVTEEHDGSRLSGEKLWQSIKKGLHMFGDLLKNYIKKAKDQMVVLRVLENLINEDQRYLPALQHILYEMSQELEILDDEVIIFWYSKKGFQTKAFPLIAKSLLKFVQWLQENEKDDSSESEED